MKILAICGSYQKKRTISTLIDKALDGVKSVDETAEVEKIHLRDHHIEYCHGCMMCHGDDPKKRIASCSIEDDMTEICRKLDEADGYIFGCPVYEGTITAIMKTFFERSCWVMSRPGHKPLEGCPEPRNPNKKVAICITSSGLMPRWITRLFGSINTAFKNCIPCTLNARIIGILYACSIGMNHPRPDRYCDQAFTLGQKLGRKV